MSRCDSFMIISMYSCSCSFVRPPFLSCFAKPYTETIGVLNSCEKSFMKSFLKSSVLLSSFTIMLKFSCICESSLFPFSSSRTVKSPFDTLSRPSLRSLSGRSNIPESIADSILPIIIQAHSIINGRSIGTTPMCFISPNASSILNISTQITPADTIMKNTNNTT